ncbi:MAG: hypothetical protein NVSMB16_04200 [Acidimicrobiales bacterium]
MTDGGVDPAPFDFHRAHCIGETLGHGVHLGLRSHPFGHDHELVAAESGHGVTWARRRLQGPGDRRQHGVPGGMAEVVVDGLEPIEVDEQDADELRRIGSLLGDGVTEPVTQQAPVGQSGECVMAGRPGQTVLGRVQLGDVAETQHDAVAERLRPCTRRSG